MPPPARSTADPAPSIAGLVRALGGHAAEERSPATGEATIRRRCIDPSRRPPGRDAGDAAGAGADRADVIIEKTVQTMGEGGPRDAADGPPAGGAMRRA